MEPLRISAYTLYLYQVKASAYIFHLMISVSTQLKFVEKGSRMAKTIQYIKNQMTNVNDIKKQ